jgi:hypothetical protein
MWTLPLCTCNTRFREFAPLASRVPENAVKLLHMTLEFGQRLPAAARPYESLSYSLLRRFPGPRRRLFACGFDFWLYHYSSAQYPEQTLVVCQSKNRRKYRAYYIPPQLTPAPHPVLASDQSWLGHVSNPLAADIS